MCCVSRGVSGCSMKWLKKNYRCGFATTCHSDKWPFPRRLNVEYIWCVCRELAVSVTFSIVFKIFLVIQWHGTWTKPEYYRDIKVLNILWTPLDSRIIHDNLDLFRGPKETKDSNWNKIHISFNYEFLFAFSSTLEASTGGVL